MYGYIYKTTNIVNNKIYIGQHKAFKFMKRRYLGSGSLLKAAIKKYGRKNFICEMLDTAETFAELNTKEIFWISKLNATDPTIGYNIDLGGQFVDKRTIVFNGERKVIPENELEYYLSLGWVDTRSELWQKTRIREYRKAHPRTYTEAQKARRKQTDHEHYVANKSKYIENALKWHQQHQDAANEYYYKNKTELNKTKRERYKLDPAFRAKQLEKARKYREAHRDEINKKQQEKRKKQI